MAAPRVLSTRSQRTTVRKPTIAPKPKPIAPPKASINRPAPYKPRPGVTAKPSTQKGWGAQSAAPASKPAIAPPTAATSTAQQPDAAYNNEVDTAQAKEGVALAGLNSKQDALKHDFGIDDPTNPFSRVEGLKRSYLARMKGQSASLASQGQLYSGTHERALAKTRFDQDQAYSQLRSAYNEAMQGIEQAKGSAKVQSAEEANAAFEAWLARTADMTPDVNAGQDVEDLSPEDAAAAAGGDGAPNAMPTREPARGEAGGQPASLNTRPGGTPQPGSTRAAQAALAKLKNKSTKRPPKKVIEKGVDPSIDVEAEGQTLAPRGGGAKKPKVKPHRKPKVKPHHRGRR